MTDPASSQPAPWRKELARRESWPILAVIALLALYGIGGLGSDVRIHQDPCTEWGAETGGRGDPTPDCKTGVRREEASQAGSFVATAWPSVAALVAAGFLVRAWRKPGLAVVLTVAAMSLLVVALRDWLPSLYPDAGRNLATVGVVAAPILLLHARFGVPHSGRMLWAFRSIGSLPAATVVAVLATDWKDSFLQWVVSDPLNLIAGLAWMAVWLAPMAVVWWPPAHRWGRAEAPVRQPTEEPSLGPQA